MRHDSGARRPGRDAGGDEATVGALVDRALEALGARRRHLFDDVTVALAQRCAGPHGAREVVTTLVPGLRDATAAAWQRGWQPADVHRMAVR